MIKIYNTEQLEILRQGGKILAKALLHIEKIAAPGMSTMEINDAAEKFIVDRGGEPSFKNYNGFPFAICASVNDEIIHGHPRTDRILANGDVLKVDVGVRFGGFCTDAARTFVIGEGSEVAVELAKQTEASFWHVAEHVRAGITAAEIGTIIEKFIKSNTKFGIVENFFGHGIGENLHQDPLIPHYRPRKPVLRSLTGEEIPENSVICIEPMITQKNPKNKVLGDGWTCVTADGGLAAHYENTIIVTADGCEIITCDV